MEYIYDEYGNLIWCEDEEMYKQLKREERIDKVVKIVKIATPVLIGATIDGLLIGGLIKFGLKLFRN